MQYREHSMQNKYTFGWIFIQELYLFTMLDLTLTITAVVMIPIYSYRQPRAPLKFLVNSNIVTYLNFRKGHR